MPHWHEYNPWKDYVVYVTLEELADCFYGLNNSCGDGNGGSFIYTKELLLEHWKETGDKLDAYILPQSSGYHDMGIRFGKEPCEYLSPMGVSSKLSSLLKSKGWKL